MKLRNRFYVLFTELLFFLDNKRAYDYYCYYDYITYYRKPGITFLGFTWLLFVPIIQWRGNQHSNILIIKEIILLHVKYVRQICIEEFWLSSQEYISKI